MARALPTLTPSDLELRLLRKGVGALQAGRDCCSDCGRTPLAGEHMHRFSSKKVVCDLCRPGHRGDPHSIEIVRNVEYARTVKLRAA